MATIPQKELRNNVGEILRRAESGEQFTITVAGRPVAELGPQSRRQWVGRADLEAIWRTPPPREPLEELPATLTDPFAR